MSWFVGQVCYYCQEQAISLIKGRFTCGKCLRKAAKDMDHELSVLGEEIAKQLSEESSQ